MPKTVTNETKQEIINFYLSKPTTIQNVSDIFRLSCPTIGKILAGVPKYARAILRSPDMDENFFEKIDSDEKAYFIGLLISDGNVFDRDSQGRQSSISITLDSSDEYILQSFKESVKTTTSIAHDGRGCSQIAVRSDKMANDLLKYGICPRKSMDTYLPEIDDEFMPGVIRGIFDGDGNIAATYHIPPDGRQRFRHAISFCGTNRLMNDIIDTLSRLVGLSHTPKVYDYASRTLSEFKIQNTQDMYNVGEWMYGNSTLCLKRKKLIYEHFKEHYCL